LSLNILLEVGGERVVPEVGEIQRCPRAFKQAPQTSIAVKKNVKILMGGFY